MKFLLSLLLISSIVVAADSAPVAPVAPRYRHVQDADGKILATIDTKDNSIDFKASREDAFRALLTILDNVVLECNKALRPTPAEKKADAPAEKKKK